MYGTVARLQPKAGKRADLLKYIADWNRERKPKLPGCVAAYLLTADEPGVESQIVAVFTDKNAYTANANEPEQDSWYRRLRDLLEDDPIWQDGEISE